MTSEVHETSPPDPDSSERFRTALEQLRLKVEASRPDREARLQDFIKSALPDYIPSLPLRYETFAVSSPVSPTQLLDTMRGYRKCSYEWGGRGKNGKGIDCSGLIVEALCDLDCAKGDTTAQILYDHFVKSKDNPSQVAYGDFVFWHESKGVTHVAVVNKVLPDGKVCVTESSQGRGYSENRLVDLVNGDPKGKYTFSFGAPLFYRSDSQEISPASLG
jgi:hypothetical protein